MIPITGNTYPVKDQLKAIGARWDPDAKVWKIAPEKMEQARKIVANAPAQVYRPSRCRDCGCAPSRYNPIYRSGVCKDCYISEKEEREMGY